MLPVDKDLTSKNRAKPTKVLAEWRSFLSFSGLVHPENWDVLGHIPSTRRMVSMPDTLNFRIGEIEQWILIPFDPPYGA